MINKYPYCKTIYSPNFGQFWVLDGVKHHEYYRGINAGKAGRACLNTSTAFDVGYAEGHKEYKLMQVLTNQHNNTEWDTSNATDMTGMFKNCATLQVTRPINTVKVKNA